MKWLGYSERGDDHLAHALDFAAQAVAFLTIDLFVSVDEPKL